MRYLAVYRDAKFLKKNTESTDRGFVFSVLYYTKIVPNILEGSLAWILLTFPVIDAVKLYIVLKKDEAQKLSSIMWHFLRLAIDVAALIVLAALGLPFTFLLLTAGAILGSLRDAVKSLINLYHYFIFNRDSRYWDKFIRKAFKAFSNLTISAGFSLLTLHGLVSLGQNFFAQNFSWAAAAMIPILGWFIALAGTLFPLVAAAAKFLFGSQQNKIAWREQKKALAFIQDEFLIHAFFFSQISPIMDLVMLNPLWSIPFFLAAVSLLDALAALHQQQANKPLGILNFYTVKFLISGSTAVTMIVGILIGLSISSIGLSLPILFGSCVLALAVRELLCGLRALVKALRDLALLNELVTETSEKTELMKQHMDKIVNNSGKVATHSLILVALLVLGLNLILGSAFPPILLIGAILGGAAIVKFGTRQMVQSVLQEFYLRAKLNLPKPSSELAEDYLLPEEQKISFAPAPAPIHSKPRQATIKRRTLLQQALGVYKYQNLEQLQPGAAHVCRLR